MPPAMPRNQRLSEQSAPLGLVGPSNERLAKLVLGRPPGQLTRQMRTRCPARDDVRRRWCTNVRYWALTDIGGSREASEGANLAKLTRSKARHLLLYRRLCAVLNRRVNEKIHRCPHCGSVLEHGSVLQAGRFSYSVAGGFCSDGKPLKVGPAIHLMLGEIMAGRGASVSVEMLRTAAATTAPNRSNSISVQLSRAKRTMLSLGIDWPIERSVQTGWFWAGPPVS